MPRIVKQHRIVTPELWSQVNPENKELMKDFLVYLRTIDRADSTIIGYEQDLRIILVWNLIHNSNKPFHTWTKRNIASIQNWFIETNENSPARVRRLKSVMSSLSNYIESVLDDDYENYRNIIYRIPNPPMYAVMEKSIIPESELERILKELTNTGKYFQACVLALALYSGKRKAELLRFKVSDFTKDHLVCGGALYRSDTIKTKGRGKNGKQLNCYTLAKKFRPYLFNWLFYRDTYNIKSEWLFPCPLDHAIAIGESSLDDWCYKLSEMLGMRFYWHAVRHTAVTSFRRAGIPDSVIKTYFGWDSLEMVGVYSDIAPEEELGKYFTADGIIIPEKRSLSDL